MKLLIKISFLLLLHAFLQAQQQRKLLYSLRTALAMWMSTKKDGEKVFVSVKDNGNGIVKKYWTKYFKPSLPPNPPGR